MTELIVFIVIGILLALAVAIYFKKQGYTFYMVFVGSLLGFTGLSFMAWKFWMGIV